jgi:hypothetical protein
MFARIAAKRILGGSFWGFQPRRTWPVLLLFLAACAAKPPPPPPSPAPALPIVPRPPPPAPPPNFNGLAPDALRARLGGPSFSRKDGATEMWRYDIGTCRAFFFFTGNQVSHIETVPAGSGGAADPACLIGLKRAP